MVQFTLPKNSKVRQGKVWNPPPEGEEKGRWREYCVYRFDPDTNENPRLDTYWVDMKDCGPMVLDALIWIKNNIVPTLLPRGCVRLLLDEYRRHQHTRLHATCRRCTRTHLNLSLATSAGDQGPRPRPHPFLRPAPLD